MAEEDSGQEKTEQPTPKRLKEAREKGDVPRSKELTTMLVLMAAVLGAFIFGGQLVERMIGMMEHNFLLDRRAVFDSNAMIAHLGVSIREAGLALAGIFGLIVVAAIVGPIALGGWNFSAQALQPKGSRIDPLAGIKRMFSLKSLVELFKALGKFALVGGFAMLILWQIRGDLIALGNSPERPAIQAALEIVTWVFMVLSAVLIIIAAIDVPYQLYDYTHKMKMTLQEVKDEMKNTEGKPEVKGRIRQLQREISQRRMMKAVPEADVVITNPTHYAVAVRYDSESRNAPIVVAKGVDFVALKIREIAAEHEVPMLQAPALARAIYHSTELDDEIPSGLFMAVAQVLAYVFQLKRYRDHNDVSVPRQPDLEHLDIPDEFKTDPPA